MDEVSFKEVSVLGGLMILEDSSCDDEVSEMNGKETLLAYLMGFAMSKIIESENRIRLQR